MFQGHLEFDEPSSPPSAPRLRSAYFLRRDAVKAAGGAEYETLLAKERVARARYRASSRAKHPLHPKSNRMGVLFKTYLCARARQRGRQRGMESTITPGDLVWPSHCPVLGFKLDYVERSGQRGNQRLQPNWPSLDRWDSTKGYVPGNVFVISHRANTLKNSATYAEILKVAKYLSRRPHHG
jgi:hypothetical protein